MHHVRHRRAAGSRDVSKTGTPAGPVLPPPARAPKVQPSRTGPAMPCLQPLKCVCLIATVGLATACAQFPQLDDRVTPAVADAAPPDLIPLGPLLARADRPDPTLTGPAGLDARLAALRARAARLRGPVIAPTQRADMLRGVR